MLRDIGMSIPTLSDDFLDDEEPREKILASFRKLLVVADKPGNVAFQTGLLVSCPRAIPKNYSSPGA